ncbi:unnamed protein product [Scytosiphon promiscuus]
MCSPPVERYAIHLPRSLGIFLANVCSFQKVVAEKSLPSTLVGTRHNPRLVSFGVFPQRKAHGRSRTAVTYLRSDVILTHSPLLCKSLSLDGSSPIKSKRFMPVLAMFVECSPFASREKKGKYKNTSKQRY